MNESRYQIMYADRPAPPALCERRGVNAQHAREQPREVEIDELAQFVGRDRAVDIINNPHR